MTITNEGEASDSIWDRRRKTQPIEVWISQPNIGVSGRVVYEDERTDTLNIDSLSMRGAQREVTGFLIQQGYTPTGRWEIERIVEADHDTVVETSRRFKPGEALPNPLRLGNDIDGPVVTSDVETESGDFYVYENWTNTFALIHRGACSFCNHGQGVQGRGKQTPNGQWHGSFPTISEAHTAARGAADRHSNRSVWTVRPCGTCLRGELQRLR
jgi:hypothetical protein